MNTYQVRCLVFAFCVVIYKYKVLCSRTVVLVAVAKTIDAAAAAAAEEAVAAVLAAVGSRTHETRAGLASLCVRLVRKSPEISYSCVNRGILPLVQHHVSLRVSIVCVRSLQR